MLREQIQPAPTPRAPKLQPQRDPADPGILALPKAGFLGRQHLQRIMICENLLAARPAPRPHWRRMQNLPLKRPDIVYVCKKTCLVKYLPSAKQFEICKRHSSCTCLSLHVCMHVCPWASLSYIFIYIYINFINSTYYINIYI